MRLDDARVSHRWCLLETPSNAPEAGGSHKATILLVDDEILVRWALADHLQECGFKVLGAPNADAAIEAIQKYEGAIDLVFSDVRMPGSMDGVGLARWVKENLPGVGVILTSGHAQAEDIAEELCDHIGEIVRKPYDFDELVRRIETKLAA